MRTRIVSSSVALLTVVAVSCGGSGDSESSPDGGLIDSATTAPAADTTVPGSVDASPPTTGLPAADATVPSADDPSATTDLPTVDAVPPGAEVDAHDYWSLDSGDRSFGVGSVDYASVIMLLLAAEADVGPMFDQITNAEPEYTSWVPITVLDAAAAEQSVAIPYEGEPEDEPEFHAILARRDKLIVAATVSGSDADARVETAIDLVELVLARAVDLSG